MTAPIDQPDPPLDEPVRPHTYDGIQEYDKRLPNWWLFTLYGAIAFSFAYWLFYHLSHVGLTDQQRLAQEMQVVQAARLASSMGALSDEQLWDLSRNPTITSAGAAVYNTNCATCHLKNLRGKEENPAAVGPSLADESWIHGDRPTQLQTVIRNGVPGPGMPAWGATLGERKIVEVVAYVLSFHQPPVAGASASQPAPIDTTAAAAATASSAH